ncbi:MAG: CDP-archaeol synthase [Luteolibacter sp.]|uniref:phosphatidate cytidylyltransferase n=1 Tax=Luteolibacter sp. TaxID=1962973 RepID=UPI003265E38A
MADNPPPPAQSKALVFARRSASTLFLWGLVTAIFVSHQAWAMLALIGFLTMVATVEYFKMMRAAGVKCFSCCGITLAAIYSGILYWHFQQGGKSLHRDIDTFFVFLAAGIPFTLQLRQPIRGLETLQTVAVNLLGFVYIALLFNFSARVTFLAPGANAVPGMVGNSGSFLLLWLLAVTKFTDMGAYIVGSMIGRHKMIPHVSPGKTWEGFGGALLFSQLAACGLYALFPQHLGFFKSWGHVVFLGFLLSILAVIGDLAESVLKRSINAKDSGRMLPGIGGSLDLIDSICFTAPALYFYLKWVLLPAA